ncbi:Outer membrane efflux protein BepC precursor [Tsuneonella dongtanensis]|uniref:Outer membrane efflux protein BepC n=1 Tax=Tsuneonella dongtanensis TaxID=692370 RepID=A0A1B2AG08_9SPHN|nr:TolC family protein [Tsuneonella dongtanensis]ANY20965.1 Outer membrane efflux protein BepC precursor [Tsuneonella dongtanensis]
MRKYTLSIATAVLLASAAPAALAQDSGPTSLQEAVAVAMKANPEIIQAQMNTEAIQAERKQAQGLYAPRVDLEASAGIRRLENTTRRNLGIADQELYPLEVGGVVDWTVIDFGRRRGELLRQAARVDGASLRVVERSEFVALQVARQYFDVLLQQRVAAASSDNVTFHQMLVGDLGKGVEQGSISIADRQQAEERLQAALVRQTEAQQDLQNAMIELQRLTGLEINQVVLPPNLASALPPSLDQAVGQARTKHPKVREAVADVDAATAMVKAAEGDLYPTVGIELRGRIGDDIDGFRGETNDLQARAVMRWNIFDGGINRAKVQEMVRRASQARYRLHELQREAEADVRTAWTTMNSQTDIVNKVERQSQVSDDLLLSYRSQFNVGRRSLLDVLDAQNTRYNTQVRLETSRFSQLFAQYQTLAATNNLLDALSIAPGAGAGMEERARFDFGPPAPAELQRRVYP